MSSVNEVNAVQRAEARGRVDGYELGHKDGHAKGYSEALEWCYKEKRTLRLWRYVIVFVIAFMLGGIIEAHGATAETTLTVTVGAEVACNPINCPEPQILATSTSQEESTQQSLLSRIYSAILEILR
jgi:hypothetical protein